MEKITKQGIISGIVRRWESQYPPTHSHTGQDKIEIGERLRKLSLAATAEQIDELIGNSSWTRLECEVCGNAVDSVVSLENEYGSCSINICERCIERAERKIKSTK